MSSLITRARPNAWSKSSASKSYAYAWDFFDQRDENTALRVRRTAKRVSSRGGRLADRAGASADDRAAPAMLWVRNCPLERGNIRHYGLLCGLNSPRPRTRQRGSRSDVAVQQDVALNICLNFMHHRNLIKS